MQGAGNDFVVLDNREYRFKLNKLIQIAPMLCNRRFGVGADGLLALDQSDAGRQGEPDYAMIYRNADGSDAGMCGNGARCMALFARRLGFGENQTFSVHDTIYSARVLNDTEVEIEFPMSVSVDELTLDGRSLLVANTGTEHIVEEVDGEMLQKESMLRETGRTLRKHPHFQPLGTNVNFICGVSEDELLLQTYERGVEDLTLACGTGAIASALAWHHRQNPEENQGDHRYHVKVKGGTLEVAFSYDAGLYSKIKLKGEAKFVFEGTFSL